MRQNMCSKKPKQKQQYLHTQHTYYFNTESMNSSTGSKKEWRADHTGQFRHHPSASPALIVRKVVGHHLFLNIIPNNFTVRTERKVWCDRGMRLTRREYRRRDFQRFPDEKSSSPQVLPAWGVMTRWLSSHSNQNWANTFMN